MSPGERPRFLFHGSPERNLSRLEPRLSTGSGDPFGALVYASPDKAVASIFLTQIKARWSAGTINSVPYALITVPREEFIAEDQGGAMYVLPSATFEADETRGLGGAEWASSESVTPIDKVEYPSALEAMIDNGVQVYFVTPGLLQAVNESSDKRAMLDQLESENQRVGKNVRQFEQQ